MKEAFTYYAVFGVVIVAAVMLAHPIARQYVAAAFGILGAILLALPNAPGWGFGAFLISNIGWMLFSYQRKQWPHFAQMSCYLLTSMVGLWNWWLGPFLLTGGAP